MLEVVHLDKRFGEIHAVRDVSFRVAKGESVGLLGPNGAGKSTTVSMISGLIRPDAYGLGIDTDTQGCAIGTDGQAHPDLLVAGPPARAACA